MNYIIAKKLKEAGFPCFYFQREEWEHNWERMLPTLSELIEEMPMREKHLGTINDAHFVLRKLVAMSEKSMKYWAYYEDEDTGKPLEKYSFYGQTPEEAVARLYLALNDEKISDF